MVVKKKSRKNSKIPKIKISGKIDRCTINQEIKVCHSQMSCIKVLQSGGF